jgi:hypothetical protein
MLQRTRALTRATRCSSATGLFSIVSGLTNFGLGQTNTSLRPWMILFLVPGAFTIVLGLLFLVLLPPSPSEAPVLRLRGYNVFTDERRNALVHAVRTNLTGEGKASLSAHEVRKALLDPKMWLFFLIATAIYGERRVVLLPTPSLTILRLSCDSLQWCGHSIRPTNSQARVGSDFGSCTGAAGCVDV